jgi:hypothetical protein
MPKPQRIETLPVPGTNFYRADAPAVNFNSLRFTDERLEVAAVVRANDPMKPTSADEAFLGPLLKAHWSHRGHGRQARNPRGTSGNAMLRQPDARALMLAGGVEIVEVKVVPQPEFVVADGSTYGFIRSPADVFFYTGHGYQGNLVYHDEPHDSWLTPEDLLAAWSIGAKWNRMALEPQVLIINGCSVLSPFTTGGRWKKLLRSEGGPIECLLGYAQRGVPLDSQGGAAVAAAMAKRIVALGDNWAGYPLAWLEVNKSFFASTEPLRNLSSAVAYNRAGYWSLVFNNKDGVDIATPDPIKPIKVLPASPFTVGP